MARALNELRGGNVGGSRGQRDRDAARLRTAPLNLGPTYHLLRARAIVCSPDGHAERAVTRAAVGKESIDQPGRAAGEGVVASDRVGVSQRVPHGGEAQRQAGSERRLGDDDGDDVIHGSFQFV